MSRIEDYALVGDLHTAALINRAGSVDWLCLPRFDSGAVMAALLDDEEAGCWQLAPAAGGTCAARQYRGDTLVLETEWRTPEGAVRVIDLMPPRESTPHLVRIVEGISGAVPMRSTLRLRCDYGNIVPWVRHGEGVAHAVAGPDALWLRTRVPTWGEADATLSEVTVQAGDRVPFVLSWAPGHAAPPAELDAETALRRTETFWSRWIAEGDHQDGPHGAAITRSLVTLKALTYAPTGGIVAAPTTSLPEQIGGPRNWDYRYCWLRDATWSLQALLAAGHDAEARAWREWLLRAVAGKPADLQIMYAVDGTRRLPESDLPWLRGYAGSTPVRTGNAAAGQLQLDVWGEVLDGLALARRAGLSSTDDAWDLQLALMEHLEGRWQDQDSGLWEMRGKPKDFTESKVMCWVAADRMVRAVRESGLPGPADRWAALRDTIHAEVLDRGYDAERNTFTQSYGSQALDASLLLIPRVGFLPPDDPRVVGTIDAVQRELGEDGLLRRYRSESSDDGMPGGEGLFLACSFWLVDALHGAGREAQARALFERLLALRNDVGLLSEEWDPVAHRQLGNMPQAFSHFALVVSALQLQHGRAPRSDHPVPVRTRGGSR